MRRYDPLARKSDPRSSSPGRSSQRDKASPGRGSQRDRRTPSPKSPRRQSPARPADRSCWEYAKAGKCQHGRDCRFERDKSLRNPAAPSTPKTGDRPVLFGTSPCTSGTATTGCMVSALLSNANTCIGIRLRVRSLSRLVLPLVRSLKMRRRRGGP